MHAGSSLSSFGDVPQPAEPLPTLPPMLTAAGPMFPLIPPALVIAPDAVAHDITAIVLLDAHTTARAGLGVGLLPSFGSSVGIAGHGGIILRTGHATMPGHTVAHAGLRTTVIAGHKRSSIGTPFHYGA